MVRLRLSWKLVPLVGGLSAAFWRGARALKADSSRTGRGGEVRLEPTLVTIEDMGGTLLLSVDRRDRPRLPVLGLSGSTHETWTDDQTETVDRAETVDLADAVSEALEPDHGQPPVLKRKRQNEETAQRYNQAGAEQLIKFRHTPAVNASVDSAVEAAGAAEAAALADAAAAAAITRQAISNRLMTFRKRKHGHKSDLRKGGLLTWLRESDIEDPEKVVMIVDSNDVLFGGCSQRHLLEHYRTIVKASGGAPVVLGAEVACQPSELAARYNRTDLEQRRLSVLRSMRVDPTWAADAIDCVNGTAPNCEATPQYRYLDYGFIMGPVRGVHGFMQAVHDMATAKNVIDQVAATEFALAHPDIVTLDYSGILALSLQDYMVGQESVLQVRNNWLGKKKIIFNRAAGQTQCFVHGSVGNGLLALEKLKADMRVAPKHAT